jgi:hypothetical protein
LLRKSNFRAIAPSAATCDPSIHWRFSPVVRACGDHGNSPSHFGAQCYTRWHDCQYLARGWRSGDNKISAAVLDGIMSSFFTDSNAVYHRATELVGQPWGATFIQRPDSDRTAAGHCVD